MPAIAMRRCNVSVLLNSFFEIISKRTARMLAKVETKIMMKIIALLESCAFDCSLIFWGVVIEKVIQLIIIMQRLKVSQPIIACVSTSSCFICITK